MKLHSHRSRYPLALFNQLMQQMSEIINLLFRRKVHSDLLLVDVLNLCLPRFQFYIVRLHCTVDADT